MECVKLDGQQNNDTNNITDKDSSVELIEINIVDSENKEEVPKTAKDLFSDFKASDESDYDPDDHFGTDSDSDEPLSKRMKTKKGNSKSKSLEGTGSPVKKKVGKPVYQIKNIL